MKLMMVLIVFFLLSDSLQPSDLSTHMGGYKSKVDCPEELFKQFIPYYALVYDMN
jgi:hypothetical protein